MKIRLKAAWRNPKTDVVTLAGWIGETAEIGMSEGDYNCLLQQKHVEEYKPVVPAKPSPAHSPTPVP